MPRPRHPLGDTGRAQQLIDTAPDGFVGMDRDGLATDWNREAERLFGYSASEAIGTPLPS